MCVLIVCLCVYGLGTALSREPGQWSSPAVPLPSLQGLGQFCPRQSLLWERSQRVFMSESQGRGTPVRAQDDSTSSESQNILESLNIETAVLPKGRQALCQLSAWDGPGGRGKGQDWWPDTPRCVHGAHIGLGQATGGRNTQQECATHVRSG